MNEPQTDLPDATTRAADTAKPNPQYDPKRLSLVKLFQLVQMLARSDDLSLAEARAFQRAVSELDSVAAFAQHILRRPGHRNVKVAFDELYSAYTQFCASKEWQPHPQRRFERLLRLKATPEFLVDAAGTDDAMTMKG
jgi:hypothetical protein